MGTKNVDCHVEPDASFGEYANSFRVLDDGGGSEVLLDFCVYSGRDNRARVVSRIRVPLELLQVIRDRITSDLRASGLIITEMN
jgi:hypothetical protein